MDSDTCNMNKQRKESDPPSYDEELSEKKSVTTCLWKRRVAIVYAVLLVAVSAAAIYFAVASARMERELEVKQHAGHDHVIDFAPPVIATIDQKPGRKPVVVAVETVEAPVVHDEMEPELQEDMNSNNPFMRDIIRRDDPRDAIDSAMVEEAQHIKQVLLKFFSIMESSLANCTWSDFKMQAFRNKHNHEKDDTLTILENISPFRSYLGIPEDNPNQTKKTEAKKAVQTVEYLNCLFSKTMLHEDITEVVRTLMELAPEREEHIETEEEDPKQNERPIQEEPLVDHGNPFAGGSLGPGIAMPNHAQNDGNPFVSPMHDGNTDYPIAIPSVQNGGNPDYPIVENDGFQDYHIAMPFIQNDGNPDYPIAMPFIQNDGNPDYPIAMPFIQNDGNPDYPIAMPFIQNDGNPDYPIAMPFIHHDGNPDSPIAMPSIQHDGHDLPFAHNDGFAPIALPSIVHDEEPITTEPSPVDENLIPTEQSTAGGDYFNFAHYDDGVHMALPMAMPMMAMPMAMPMAMSASAGTDDISAPADIEFSAAEENDSQQISGSTDSTSEDGTNDTADEDSNKGEDEDDQGQFQEAFRRKKFTVNIN